MEYTEQEQRIAALLTVLGQDVVKGVLTSLPSDTGSRVQQLLDEFSDDPLEEEELEEVLEEFVRFFRFAVQQEQVDGDGDVATEPPREGSPGRKAETERAAAEKKPFVATGDPYQDLRQLEVYQIAGALRGENPRTIAVVLNCLPSEMAGRALQFLPEEVRGTAFLMLRDPPKTPPQMLERIVRTTVTKGAGLDLSAVADPSAESNRKMADLLRAMGQVERAQMLRTLEAQDPEIIEQIKKLLYTFDDVKKLANRSIQKILGEVDSQTLAMALKGVDEAISEKILSNLSKRARATLVEEMEFLGHVKPAEQEAARSAICEVVGRLDESGDLEME